MSKDPKQSDDQSVIWSKEEEQILHQNMEMYPADKFTELKRYTLLLTNLPHKRLRDVATKVKFEEYNRTHNPPMRWDDFCRDKSLIRPQRSYPITKGHSRSSSDNSEIESSSIKQVNKRIIGEPMTMQEKNVNVDSFEGNISESMQNDEMKQPFMEMDQMPNSTVPKLKNKRAKQAKKQKTKTKQGNTINNPTDQMMNINQNMNIQNPNQALMNIQQNQMNGIKMEPMMNENKMNPNLTVPGNIPSINQMPNNQILLTDEQNNLIHDITSLMQMGESIIQNLDVNNTINLEAVSNFETFVTHVLNTSQQLAGTNMLLPTFNIPFFTRQYVELMNQNPQCIYTLIPYQGYGLEDMQMYGGNQQVDQNGNQPQNGSTHQ